MYIDHPQAPRPGYKFNGYYFKYPSEQGYQGMVSTISDDPPMLNWMYVDKDTGAVRYGSRKDTIGHVIGPWGWNDDESLLTFDGEDWRFIAVEEELPRPAPPEGEAAAGEKGEGEGEEEPELVWAVYLSRDGDASLKPKAEKKAAQQQRVVDEDEEGEGGDDDDDEDGVDVRYTNDWAPIRLERKLQLGVDSSYVKGQSGNK